MARNVVRDVPKDETSMWVICTKTHGACMLLRPDGLTERLSLGLAERCRREVPGVHLHIPTFQSNHYHLLASFDGPKPMADFMNRYNSILARVMNQHLDRIDAFWGNTYSASLVPAEAELQQARYVLGQGLGEGLYRRAIDNPCANAVRALTEGEPLLGLDIDLGRWARAAREDPDVDPLLFTEELTVQLTPLPSLAHLTPQAQQLEMRKLVREAEEEGAAKRKKDKIYKVLGAAAMRAMDPFTRPKRTKKGSSAPLCHGPPEVRKAARSNHKANMAQRDASLDRAALQFLKCQHPESMHPPSALVPALRRLAQETPQGRPDG